MTETLKLSSIRLDGGIQLRAETNEETVASYATDMLAGDVFPPIVVYHDGSHMWLSDGFHRYFAAQQARKDEIEADVRQGTLRDAFLYAAEANRRHGLPLSNKDKRRIAELFLSDPEWTLWSDREIARRSGLSNRFISTMRQELSVNGSQMERKVERNGTIYTLNTTNIGATNDQSIQQERQYIRPEDQAAFDAWKATFDEVLREYVSDLATRRPDFAAMIDAYLSRVAYLGESGSTGEDQVLRLMEDELDRFLGIRRYAVELPKDDDPFILDWDAEEQELHALMEQEKTAKTGVFTIACRIGQKLCRFRDAWGIMEAMQDRLPEWVDNALHVGQILREAQAVLTPEQFTCWVGATNGLGTKGKYIQALLAAIQHYEEGTLIAQHKPNHQMLLALACYNCVAVANRKDTA